MIDAILLAQAADAARETHSLGQFLANLLPPLIAMAFIGYFLLVRPVKKQEAERRAMVAAVKKNARVLTSAGIIGKVLHIKEDDEIVLLKLDEGKISVLKSSIARVLPDGEGKAPAAEEEASGR
jgi:preprotein translocase subunit YajC